MTSKTVFPSWAIIVYRGVRAAVGAGIAQALILQPDWSKQDQAIRTLCVAFIAGFSVCIGKYIRDQIDVLFGYDEKSTIAKVMPI